MYKIPTNFDIYPKISKTEFGIKKNAIIRHRGMTHLKNHPCLLILYEKSSFVSIKRARMVKTIIRAAFTLKIKAAL